MNVVFDPAKDRRNIAKHRVSLALAEQLEWDLMTCWEDDRERYFELRLKCLAPIGSVIYCVALTEHDDHYRVFSLRKATPKEVRDYVHRR